MKITKLFFDYIALQWDCWNCGLTNKIRFDKYQSPLDGHKLKCSRCKSKRKGMFDLSGHLLEQCVERPDDPKRQKKLEKRKDWYAKDWIKRNKNQMKPKNLKKRRKK